MINKLLFSLSFANSVEFIVDTKGYAIAINLAEMTSVANC